MLLIEFTALARLVREGLKAEFLIIRMTCSDSNILQLL